MTRERSSRSLSSFLAMSLFGACAMALPAIAHAAVAVTEIMYNPTGSNVGHQWVEVTNTGTDPIDLGAKNIRLFDSSGNHLIKAYGTGSAATTEVPVGESAVISQNPLTFLSDYPSYSGTLLKSSFTLTATGIVGITQTDGTILDKVSYSSAQGAKGDGNSLQRVQSERGSASASFISGAPTPGMYPLTPPTALIAPVKQIAASKSSSKSKTSKTKKTSKSVTSKNYEKGMTAPADSADAESAGALPAFSFSMPAFTLPSFVTPYIGLFSSAWFAAFLALLGFSAFSLLVIQRTTTYA
jgi:hypothetical protein